MDNLWILVAHQAGARIFSRNRPSDGIKLVEEILFPEGRLRDRDIDSDRPGRVYSHSGPLIHGLTAPTDPHRAEAMRFAQSLAERLSLARSQNRFFRLVLVAGPEEMGLLKGSLEKQTAERVIGSLNKNLSKVRDLDVENQLLDVLADAEEKIILQRSA